MISIARPLIGKEEKEAVLKVLDSGALAQGKLVEEFEKNFAEFIGTSHAVATSSGTTALHLALLAAGIKEGDEVITTPFTFIASSTAILFCNAKPVFADIDEKTFNISPREIEKKISKKTKAILPVHLYGQSCAMDEIMEIAEKHNLIVIEDSCQAHGAEFNGKKAGSIGNAGCFSFYPTKNMTTGEGGIISTNDSKIDEMSRLLRSHGSRKRYFHEILGFNFRMTDISAAIGLQQLKKLEKFNMQRQKNAMFLSKELSKISGIIPPAIAEKRNHVFHQYTIRVSESFPLSRDKVCDELSKREIGFSVFYPITVNRQPVFKNSESMPVAEKIAQQVLSLPVHPSISEDDLKKIVEAFNEMSQC